MTLALVKTSATKRQSTLQMCCRAEMIRIYIRGSIVDAEPPLGIFCDRNGGSGGGGGQRVLMKPPHRFFLRLQPKPFATQDAQSMYLANDVILTASVDVVGNSSNTQRTFVGVICPRRY